MITPVTYKTYIPPSQLLPISKPVPGPLPLPAKPESLANALSNYYGLPVRNNRELMKSLEQVEEARKQYPLDDLLCMPRPSGINCSLEEMRCYWKAHRLDQDAYYKDSPLMAVLFPEPIREEPWELTYKHYTLALVLEVARRKFVTGEELAQGIDKEGIKEFLKELALLDGSAGTLWGVHMMLGIVTLLRAGTEKHRAAFLKDSEAWKTIWCMCLTEMGHGSNVLGLRTTATLDPRTGEWVINSNKEEFPSSLKWWPGGLAMHANHAIVMAQMIVADQWHGPHFFAIRIRDEDGHSLRGITIGHMGTKVDLNGIDNGYCWFDQMRVSKDAHLDHFSTVELKDNVWTYVPKDKGAAKRDTHYLQLLSSFVVSRQYIVKMASIIPEGCALLLALYPPPALNKESHHQLLCRVTATAYMLKMAESLIEGEEKAEYAKEPRNQDHILASLFKAFNTDMGEKVQNTLIMYYSSVTSRTLCTFITNCRDQNTGPQIYEGVNPRLYTLASSKILKDILMDSAKWEEACENKDPPYFERPIVRIREKMYHLYKPLQDHMMQLMSEGKDPMATFGTGPGPGEDHAIEAAKLWGHLLVLEEAHKKIQAMETPMRTLMEALYILYTDDNFPGCYPKKDVYQAYETLKGSKDYADYHSFKLVAAFKRPIDWIDAQLRAPRFSVRFDQDLPMSRL